MSGMPKIGRKAVAAGILLAALTAVLLIVSPWRSERPATFAIGALAPPIEGTDTAGDRIALGDSRSRPVLVNFWASWCGPCVNEMPMLDEAYRASAGSFDILFVNVGETKGTVNEFLREHRFAFSSLIDATGRAASSYRVTGLPATFAIDAEGRLQQVVIGELKGRAHLDRLMRDAGAASIAD